MPLKVVWGHVNNRLAVIALSGALERLQVEGTLYLGYPVLPQSDSTTTVEALLVSRDPGLIAFNFPNENTDREVLKREQDSLAYAVEGNLQKHENLRSGRRLAVTVNTISFFGTNNRLIGTDGQYLFSSPDNISDCLIHCARVSSEYYRVLCAAIERVTNIKPIKKRENVSRTDSKGGILKEIERQIANLDEWQRQAAIETPDGPQRVRGLAGSGKTVVLALKAAYLHTQHPDWNIAVTFYTRSLSQQFTDLIDRFVLEHSGDKPDWKKIQVLHAWGSYTTKGVYYTIADALGVVPMDFSAAMAKFGRRDSFAGICRDLLPLADTTPPNLFDAILIDEAQDLPAEFLQLVHAATKEPKRIVWAYDELQNLSNTTIAPVHEVFRGKVTVRNTTNAPQQDIILPICYRNTPWALTLAHGLGFGLYRNKGLVQLFDELELWEDIGYIVENGSLDFDSDVTLRRRHDSYPSFFYELLDKEESVVVSKFNNPIEQYEWIADEIKRNIEEDELDPDDILIILPDMRYAKMQYHDIRSSLSRRQIQCHLAGVSTQLDVFTVPGSVAVSGIYRAKGNEAPMVYVANADYCAEGTDIISLRNTLFTAITRSRAWVRICGSYEKMDALIDEINRIISNDYRLTFHIPTQEELRKIRLINRDLSHQERNEIKRVEKEIDKIQKLVKDGVLTPETSRKLQELKVLLVEQTTFYGDE